MNESKKQKLTDVIVAIIAVISVPKYLFKVIIYWLLLLFILLWLFNLPLLFGIATDTPSELPVILVEGYLNLFRFGLGLTPTLLLITSFFQAVSFAIKSYLNQHKSKNRIGFSITAMSLVGAGCVACGGSIIAPVLSVLGLTSVAGLNQSISNIILIFASLLSIYSVVRVGQIASTLLNIKGNK